MILFGTEVNLPIVKAMLRVLNQFCESLVKEISGFSTLHSGTGKQICIIDLPDSFLSKKEQDQALDIHWSLPERRAQWPCSHLMWFYCGPLTVFCF